MPIPASIIEKVDKLRNHILELEGQLRDSKMNLAFAEDLLADAEFGDVKKPSSDVQSTHTPIQVTTKSRRQTSKNFRKGSKAEMALNALKKSDGPLHISQLLTAMGMDNTDENRRMVAATLRTKIKLGQHFVLAAPNTFDLLSRPKRKAEHLNGRADHSLLEATSA